MRIDNRTHWRTDDLRRILQRCAVQELDGAKRKVLVVTVKYGRKRGESSGCARIRGREATIRINKHEPNAAAFAWVAVHEFRHIRGWTHKQMPGTYSEADTERYAWANDCGIRRQAPRRRARPDDDAKLAHALAMLARARTRVKRAQTIEKRWRVRVRYYERRLALDDAIAEWSGEQIAAGSAQR